MTRCGQIARWIVALGIVARALRLACRFPLWSDEAAVALNLYGRGWRGILEPLDYHQVAPKFFLLLEKAAMVAGGGELSLRVLPYLAGIIALICFAKWAKRIISAPAGLFALALAAFSAPLIDLSAQVKPYSLDLLLTVVILYYAERSLRAENPWKRCWPLLIVAGVGAGFSFASLLVMAGVIVIGCVAAVLRRREYPVGFHASYWLAGGVISGGSYLLFFRAPQLNDETQAFMQTFWAGAFPPRAAMPFLHWIVTIHTGDMLAYPTGGIFPIPLLLLTALGAYRLLRRRPWLAALLLSPFVTTFIAAAMHRYPYGWKVRVAQQFAPSIWVFAGVGMARLLSSLPRVYSKFHLRRGALAIAVLVVAGVGAAAVAIGFVRPYQHPEDAQERSIAEAFIAESRSAGTVIFTSPREDIPRTLLWYLRQLPQAGANHFVNAPPRPALVVAIEPGDNGLLRTTLAEYPRSSRVEWVFPGRAPHTRVRLIEVR